MVVRITLESLSNPILTARMILKFLKCSRAILIPKDGFDNSVVILDSNDETGLLGKIRSIRAPLRCEVLGDEFEEMIRKLEKPIRKKQVFVIEVK